MVWTMSTLATLIGPASWSGAQFLTAIKGVFNNLGGMTLIDEVNNRGASGYDSQVWQIPGLNPNATFGNLFWLIEAQPQNQFPLGFRQFCGTAWNVGSDVMTNSSSVYSYWTAVSIGSSTGALQYVTFSGPEGRIILLWPASNTNAVSVIGWLRPQILPPGWSENAQPCVFPLQGNNISSINSNRIQVTPGLITPSGQAYGSQYMPLIPRGPLNAGLDGKYAIMTPFTWASSFGNTNYCAGPTFSDIGRLGAIGLPMLSTVTIGGQTWVNIDCGDSSHPALVLRTA